MNNKNALDIRFKIKSYRIVKFNFNTSINEVIEIEKENLKYNFKSGFSIRRELNQIGVLLGVDINLDRGQPINIFNSEFEYIFEIDDISKFKHDDKSMTIPDQFMITLVSISFSTTRGIILGKSAGTILDKIIMPLIDPKKLLPQKNRKISKSNVKN